MQPSSSISPMVSSELRGNQPQYGTWFQLCKKLSAGGSGYHHHTAKNLMTQAILRAYYHPPWWESLQNIHFAWQPFTVQPSPTSNFLWLSRIRDFVMAVGPRGTHLHSFSVTPLDQTGIILYTLGPEALRQVWRILSSATVRHGPCLWYAWCRAMFYIC